MNLLGIIMSSEAHLIYQGIPSDRGSPKWPLKSMYINRGSDIVTDNHASRYRCAQCNLNAKCRTASNANAKSHHAMVDTTKDTESDQNQNQ